MERVWPQQWSVPQSAGVLSHGIGYGAIFTLGVLLFYLSQTRPAQMPVWTPWDFSWSEYLATMLSLLWFFRGRAVTATQVRLPLWRCVAFLAGLIAIYAVLQTRFDYMAQHMFFLNRIQHVVMHHLGPFLVALGCAGGTIKRGMPRWARRVAESRLAVTVIYILQQPFLAALLFIGLFFFWMVPVIHFRAMIDWRLYAVMNWSMVIDGILFWSLVLDPRPKPHARISFGARAALSIGVMFPQILVGAAITFSQHDLYAFYDLCGRLFPSISALADQHIGGIVIWIPPAMMSLIGVLVVLNSLRLHEESTTEVTNESSPFAAPSIRHPGR